MHAIAGRGPIDESRRATSELLGAQLVLAASRGNDAAAPLLAAARSLETLNVDLARETYLDAFTASLFGARLNVTVNASDVAAAASAAPHGRADESRAVDILLDAFTAITSDYERAVPLCRAAVDRLDTDMSTASTELRWFWHGTVLALELWDDHGAYSLSDHHTRVARSTGALSQLALGVQVAQQHVEAVDPARVLGDQVVSALGEQAHDRGVVLDPDAVESSVVQRYRSHRDRVGDVGLAGAARPEQSCACREFGGHVEDDLAGGDELLGDAAAEAGGALDSPLPLGPLGGPGEQRGRGVLVHQQPDGLWGWPWGSTATAVRELLCGSMPIVITSRCLSSL